jgi:hypothetical protein
VISVAVLLVNTNRELSTANMVEGINATTKRWWINNDEQKWQIDIDE